MRLTYKQFKEFRLRVENGIKYLKLRETDFLDLAELMFDVRFNRSFKGYLESEITRLRGEFPLMTLDEERAFFEQCREEYKLGKMETELQYFVEDEIDKRFGKEADEYRLYCELRKIKGEWL